MVVGIQDELLRLHSMGLLSLLLADKTQRSRKTEHADRAANILWATDAYQSLGPSYDRDREIEAALITGTHSDVIKNRARKAMEQQSERVRKHGEVFTPRWVCRKMVSHGDAMWFGKGDPFLAGNDPSEKILFPEGRKWTRYVDERRLEITCGEAPYLVQRYDVETGEVLSLRERQGILDRKLRVVGEETADEEEWVKWAFRAFEATYGYEWQGDNVLIARINLLMTFEEYLKARWRRAPSRKEYERLTKIITWNLWQMDGLTGRIPYCHRDGYESVNLFRPLEEPLQEKINFQPRCRIYNWRRGNSLEYLDVNTGGRAMKFDFIIGNPPYQDEGVGNKTFAPPIYHLFMDAAFQISNKVELIHPARFLFNAGSTPKQWNQKMLSDPHFSVLYYEPDASKLFPGTDIKGGVAITYRDITRDFGEIGIFTAYPELNSISHKVLKISHSTLDKIVTHRGVYRFSDKAFKDYPEEKKKISDSRILSGAFERFPKFFFNNPPETGREYIRIYGKENGKRVYKWIRKDYVKQQDNLYKYKVMVPKANGSGALGEVLSTPLVGQPLVGQPLVGFTETFISIGEVETNEEAEAILKYVKSKFARTMLGILKITQDNTRQTWRMVPLQDFTSSSDIDWSKSIADIDQQLYKKYGLNEKEIQFIETHVKEMK